MTYASLSTDGTLTVHEGKATAQDINRLVGGWFEALSLVTGTMYLNEEGKLLGLPPNEYADTVHQGLGYAPLVPGDFLVGTVVFVGGPDHAGDDTSLSEQDISRLSSYAKVVQRP